MGFYFRLSKFFLYVSVFAATIVSQATIFPFIIGKYVWFRTTIDLALIFFLLGILGSPQEAEQYIKKLKNVLKSPIAIVVGLFVLMFILAGFFGVDPANSFWSNFERGEGGLQIIHFYIFFLLLATMFFEEGQWIKIFSCSIVAAFIMIGYGILAGFGINGFLGQLFIDPGFRFGGAIGNSAYVAAYLIFIIFYALYIFFTKYRQRSQLFGNIIILVPIIIFFGAFLAAATRGAVLGLIAAAIAFLLYLIFTAKKIRKISIIFIASLILIFSLGVKLKDSEEIKKLPFSRIFDISVNTQTFHDRIVVWKMAWDGFKKRPILGYGPENFLRVFEENFNTDYYNPLIPSSREFSWFDRAHSVIFDYLSETGILGFFSYASIFGTFYFFIFRKFKKQVAENNQNSAGKFEHSQNRFLSLPLPARALVFSLPIAYLVQGLVLFDTLPVYINLFMFFAFVYYIFNSTIIIIKNNGKSQKINKDQKILNYQIVSIIGIIFAILSIIYGSIFPYLKAMAYTADMNKPHTVGDFKDRFNNIYNIYSPISNKEISLYLVDNIRNLISNQQNQPEQIMRLFVDFIEDKIDKNDVRQLMPMAKIYSIMWERYGNEGDYRKSVDYYLTSLKIGPKLPPALYGLFSLYYLHNDNEAVENIGKNILQYWPQDKRIINLLKEVDRQR
ncbi:O-antigen ligase family protein [Candidatus Wolfebacteria bacterium]|nr:O-antigen ligase family protein [Candidatus Wolfebacteria bacterium]